MNILIIGSGGREHAFAWKISQSPKIGQLFIAPGNTGTAEFGTNLEIGVADFKAIRKAVLDKKIDMVVVGPEVPLVEGIHDFFLADELLKLVPVIGPVRRGAMLEGSKDYAKEFMMRYSIPTAAYYSVTKDNLEQGISFIHSLKAPYVLKADGLAAGKGVLIIENVDEAEQVLRKMLGGMFGQASETVVIEEFLTGIECSVFALTDGKNYKILPVAKDYKRIGVGDTGLNTGGMGAISPVPFADEIFMKKVEERIVIPTVNGLHSDGIEYKGFIFFGLISVNSEPFVIEYNVRMGDPETEAVILRLKSDLVDLFEGVANGDLADRQLDIDADSAVTVMLVAGGYPGAYEKGDVITDMDKVSGSILFHAGTRISGNDVVTNGGRVLSVSSKGKDFKEALKLSYQNASKIQFKNMYFRKDLGFDL
ncbi:MAG: phosphoribosylamine--glycine ligase [Bacteroidia bacterium]|nr:phosphoribosylamine--glycine ligase [Bacteroidia bacterium]